MRKKITLNSSPVFSRDNALLVLLAKSPLAWLNPERADCVAPQAGPCKKWKIKLQYEKN